MATKPSPLNTFANVQAPAPTPAVPVATVSSPSKEKMEQKVFRLTPAQAQKLREFCAHTNTTLQDVVVEGINLVLKSKGLPPI